MRKLLVKPILRLLAALVLGVPGAWLTIEGALGYYIAYRQRLKAGGDLLIYSPRFLISKLF